MWVEQIHMDADPRVGGMRKESNKSLSNAYYGLYFSSWNDYYFFSPVTFYYSCFTPKHFYAAAITTHTSRPRWCCVREINRGVKNINNNNCCSHDFRLPSNRLDFDTTICSRDETLSRRVTTHSVYLISCWMGKKKIKKTCRYIPRISKQLYANSVKYITMYKQRPPVRRTSSSQYPSCI